MSLQTNKFWQSLVALLPTGFAWPRDPSSTLMRVFRGFAVALAEHHAFAQSTALDWLPHRTVTRLAEWEEACGLPCDCLGTEQTVDLRQGMLLATLRGASLTYLNSSPAAPGAIVGLAAGMGYQARVVYNTPMRVGLGLVGQPLGSLDGVLQVVVTVPQQPMRVGLGAVGQSLATTIWPAQVAAAQIPFRVGLGRVGQSLVAGSAQLVDRPIRVGLGAVGDRLTVRPAFAADFACLLDRLAPARYSINLTLEFVNVTAP